MEKDPNIYNVDTTILADKIKNWRLAYLDEINSSIVGNSLIDQRTVARFIDGQISDTQVLMQWCEILAHKVEQLEAKIK